MKTTAHQNIDNYIADFPLEIQKILQSIRSVIKKSAPKAEEAISYAIPTFKLNKNLIHFAAFKNHIGIYPVPTGNTAFQKKMERYKSGRGTAKFLIQQPIPYDLISEMVKFRIKEITADVSTS